MKNFRVLRFLSICLFLNFGFFGQSHGQLCYNDIFLGKPPEMLEIGVFWDLETGLKTYGNTRRMFLVDKDMLVTQKVCAVNDPYKCLCADIVDEKIVAVVGVDSSNFTNCLSADKIYVDIIDVKFTYTHLPLCGTIVLKNVSDPMNVQDMGKSYDDLMKENKYQRDFELRNFVLSDLTSYKYIIENEVNHQLDTITSAIGDEISIPEGKYKIKLCVRGAENKLFQTENVDFSSTTVLNIPTKIIQDSLTIYLGDSVRISNFYAKQAGDYTYSIKNKQGCDSIVYKTHLRTKYSKSILGHIPYIAIRELKVDSKNNVYFLALHALPYSQLKIDLDPTSDEKFYTIDRTKGNSELLIKLSPEGDLIWAHHFSSPGSINLYSFDIGPDDKIYIGGDFRGDLDVDFDPNQEVFISNPDYRTKGFVVCIDENATFKWVKKFESQYGNFPQKIKVDNQSNVYVGGTFRGTFDADPGSGLVQYESGNYGDAFIVKLNSAGSYLWSTSISGSYQEEIRDFVLDQSRNSVFVLGRYQKTLNPNYLNKSEIYASNENSEDIFLIKLDTSGAYGWTKTLGSPESEDAVDLKLDSKGNIVFSGSFGGEIDLNPNSGTDIHTVKKNENDLFVTKLTNSGDFVWAKTIGNKKYETNFKIAIDQNDYIYGFATHGDTLDVNPNEGVFNLMAEKDVNQAYFVKLSESGDLLWSEYFSNYINSSSSTEMTITFDNENNLIAAGSGAMIWESYILKIKQECNIQYKTDSICNNQSYIFGNQTLTHAGQYKSVFDTQSICDSIVYLTLHKRTKGCTVTAENHVENNTVEFYPNPVNQTLTIENLPIGEMVSVYDILGVQLSTQKVSDTFTYFEFQNLPKGIYIIRTQNQNFRILKE